ncbi:MAG: hypothetical protein ABSG87_07635 [Verrucomicrobiota bacterium]|jgi:hypothetical protein
MKKTLVLTLAASILGVSHLMASTVDLYITGSTAFRANVYNACASLYDGGAPGTVVYGTSATGGNSPQSPVANNYQWTMSGSVGTAIPAFSGDTFNIHALFTGSVQGLQSVQQGIQLIFLDASGNPLTNTATIAFSDVASASTPYPVSSSFNEDAVAIQPFVFVKSIAASGDITSVTNITAEQLKYIVQNGKCPGFAWTHNPSDTGTIYLINRTKDSGTRRTTFAEIGDQFGQSAQIYNFDATNFVFYKATNVLDGAHGGSGGGVPSIGVVGPAGNNNNNANSTWGPGYVGGGDIKSELQVNNAANQAISYLSFSDAKGVTGVNWSQVISYNGVWPTGLGSGLAGNTSTNDFSPVSEGLYPFWAVEVLVYPNADPLNADQDLTASELATVLGVLNAQTVINGGSPTPGSIEYTIQQSEAGGATAVRLAEMNASRQAVGGLITP